MSYTEDFICKRKLQIEGLEVKLFSLQLMSNHVYSKKYGVSPKKSHLISQTENAFSVDSVQYIVCNILCRQCAMYCDLLLCYHTARLSSLCKIVCHKATDLCMKKDDINALVLQA